MSKHKYYDPEDVKLLRTELLRAGLAIMQDKKEVEGWSAIKKEYVLKVGSRVLPILNAGRDDDKDLSQHSLLYVLHHSSDDQDSETKE